MRLSPCQQGAGGKDEWVYLYTIEWRLATLVVKYRFLSLSSLSSLSLSLSLTSLSLSFSVYLSIISI
jgi:hypothetical protein